MKWDSFAPGFAFVACASATVAYLSYAPPGEPPVLRGVLATANALMASALLLLAIRSIIREELERKDSTP